MKSRNHLKIKEMDEPISLRQISLRQIHMFILEIFNYKRELLLNENFST